MIKKITLDSSVIVASLLKKEPRHEEAFKLWTDLLSGKYFAIMPYSVLVEIVAAIRRRTGIEELAIEVMKELMKIENIFFVTIDEKSAKEAAKISAKTSLRGMDSIVVQVAIEFNCELITFDEEMLNKARFILKK